MATEIQQERALLGVNMTCCRSTRRRFWIKICLAWRSTLKPFASMESQWSQYSWGHPKELQGCLSLMVPIDCCAIPSIFTPWKSMCVCVFVCKYILQYPAPFSAERMPLGKILKGDRFHLPYLTKPPACGKHFKKRIKHPPHCSQQPLAAWRS